MSRGDESKRLADLIDSVADGRDVDWDAASVTTDARMRRVLAMLRIVEGIAQVQRTESPTPEEASPGPAAAGTSPTIAAPADQWGHFRLLEKLGEGSFGEVYHAHDTWLEHSVALKLLKPGRVDRKRFLHEARTLAHIRHPNVVAIHGADEHDGRLGFWMDFIDGHTLADVVAREGVRSSTEAAVIGQDLCRAIAAVHAANIVHRDIKAQNVMRQSQTGHILLMDFGAGEAMDADPASRRPTGTPLYLAPELFDGSAATRESDVYALGVLLFNLVTRKYPVYADSFGELLLAHQRMQRLHLGDVRPDLPDAFVRVVETMVAPDPANRYHRATEARRALEEVVGTRGDVWPVPPLPSPTWRERLLRWAAWTTVIIASLSAMGIVSTAAFDTALGRGGFNSESFLQASLGVGVQAMVAPLVSLTIYTNGVLLLSAIARVFCRLLPPAGRLASRAAGSCAHFFKGRELHDPALLLQVTAGLGALAFAVLAFAYWQNATIFAIYVNTAAADRLAALQPANEPRYDVLQRLLEFVLLAYVLVVYNVYAHVRRSRQRVPASTTAYVFAVPLVALLLMRAMPFRVVYANEFKRVDLGTTRCYQVGDKPGWVRLFCPDAQPPRVRDLRESDPSLHDRNITESVFTPREQAAVFDTAAP